MATPEPIPEGTIALVVRGVDWWTMGELASRTGLTIIKLEDGQTLEAMSEEDMGRAGWCRCPTPGFPVVSAIEPTPEMVKLHGRAMATGMANLPPADLEESP